jgi:hypothetical protein
MEVETIPLPALRIASQAAKAHTQGLEVAGGKYYVTARREDVRPRRALLLRTEAAGTNWDAWDITPVDAGGELSALDHPGGMQSDGKGLWIPVAESRPKSHALIRVFPLRWMVPGQPLKPDFEFAVQDHIGAIAVAADRGLVLGANWDTKTVYVWDMRGRLQQTLTGAKLGMRGLGTQQGALGEAGVAVQDWKAIGDRLFASGFLRARPNSPVSPKSRWISFNRFLQPDFSRQVVTLPLQHGTELAREAMAVSGGQVYFLPEDLGATNRVFRVAGRELLPEADTRKTGAGE